MQTRTALALALCGTLGVIIGCWPSTAAAITVSGGTYTGAETWDLSESPVKVSGTPRIAATGSLTIEPGVVVKFVSGGLRVEGTLHASGSESQRITFTSVKDDSIGGDTGGDGSSSGARGDWGTINVSGNATMEYADVRYGSAVSNVYTGSLSALITLSAIYVSPGGSLTMDHANVTDNKQNGLGVYNGSAVVTKSLFARNYHAVGTEDAIFSLDQSTVRDNDGYALWFRPATSDAWAGPSITRSNITRNKRKGIYILTSLSPTPPAYALPHGSQNNIYANNFEPGNDTDSWGTELYGGYSAMNWTGNFWGLTVDYVPSPSGCPADYPGRLRLGDGPRSPIPQSSSTRLVNGSYVTCWQNRPYIAPNDFDHHYIDNGAYDDYSQYYGLVQQYAPILRLDGIEAFRTVSPGAMTDFYEPSPFDPLLIPDTNSIHTGNGARFAVADPSYVDPNPPGELSQLNLDYLGATYADPPTNGWNDGTTASAQDYLSARGDDNDGLYDDDADAVTDQHPDYADRAYARIALGSDGRVWIQYWLFYYFNSRAPVHEGDWEMVQVGLNGTGVPDKAAYAQHTGGQQCDWSLVEKTDEHPNVYVARDSHASYFDPVLGGTLIDDVADGQTPPFSPGTATITDNSPRWAAWLGKWGDSDSSPAGPAHGGNSDKRDPGEWASDLNDC